MHNVLISFCDKSPNNQVPIIIDLQYVLLKQARLVGFFYFEVTNVSKMKATEMKSDEYNYAVHAGWFVDTAWLTNVQL